MAAALEPVTGEEVRVRRESLDAITGGREFDPQLTGRGKKGTKLERKYLRRGEKSMPREEEVVLALITTPPVQHLGRMTIPTFTYGMLSLQDGSGS